MKLRECIAYLKEKNTKEYAALEAAIEDGYPATEIHKALKHTIETMGKEPVFGERVMQRLIKSIREGEKNLNEYLNEAK